MAGDKTYSIKVVVYPFDELDKKKRALMAAKDIGLNIKPKNFQFSDKFSVTSVKWDKRKIEDAARTMFRYDLALLAAQMWQAFVPIQKAKNGQDKKNATNKFLKDVPKLVKATEKKLAQSFAEFKEEVASGATDDVGQLKATRESLTAGHPDAMMEVVSKFIEEFKKAYRSLAKMKKKEQKSSGEAKEEAAEALADALDSKIPELLKSLDAQTGVLKKRVGVLSGVPAAMKKSMNKDLSDAAKAEFKSAMDVLSKATPPLESQVAKFNKTVLASLQKMQRKDVGSSVFDQADAAASNLINAAAKLDDLMKKIDANLKKLEQTAKKR